MRVQLFISLLAVIIAVAQTLINEEEDIDDSLYGYDHPLVARDIFAEESYGAAAGHQQDIDTSLDGYDHEVVARDLHQRSKNYKRAPPHVRDALSEDAYDLIHEHGKDVDISLDGYDHDIFAREIDEESIGKMKQAYIDFDNARKLGSMEPHPVVPHERRDVEDVDEGDDEDDDTPWVELDSDEPEVARRSEASANEAVGAYLEPAEEYDDDDDDDSEMPYAAPDPDYDGEDRFGTSSIYARQIQETEEDEDEDIDYSLEGYDHSLLRRGLEEAHFEDWEGSDESIEERSAHEYFATERRAAEVHEEDEMGDNALSEAWSTVKRWVDELVG